MTVSTTCGGAAANDAFKRVVGTLIVAFSGQSFVNYPDRTSVARHLLKHLGTRSIRRLNRCAT